MALTDEQRRAVDNLHALVKDIDRRLGTAVTQAEDVLPPGAMPGLLADAKKNVGIVEEILAFMVVHMEDLRSDDGGVSF